MVHAFCWMKDLVLIRNCWLNSRN